MALTQKRAEARSACIKQGSIHYTFHIALQEEHYFGLSETAFSLTSVPAELALDCKSPDIKDIWINGEVSQNKPTEQGYIFLDVSKLKQGPNIVCVHYRNTYDNDGSGLVSFTDVDTKQYLYTQFEPYFANRVFALFDQPDLKAKMTLSVIYPPSWKKVLSNEYSTLEKPFEAGLYHESVKTSSKAALDAFLNGKKGDLAVFPDTKLLPTYLYCFIAGEYLQLKLEKTYKNIPMSIYCIGSLFEHMKGLADFIFEITIESMKFFESFFGYEFAFNKYDQVFAHQYKWGAMENAGIVTFNDRYIFKEKFSTEKMLNFSNTISHQLAHHWFGNLVTMKWWDDLWLNESFADFISHFCLEKIRENVKTISYESSMSSFLQRKSWGYHQDQMITTHPIRGAVANTSVAQSIFDGITYSKGAATMKQLLFLMTEQNFSKALSTYFHKYAWQNATINDFLAEMQQHFTITDFSLTDWRGMWLEKESLNQIEAHWDPKDESPKATITIKQTPYTEVHPTLRYHKIKICLFRQDLSTEVLTVLLRLESETKVDYDGSQHFKAILLNYEDQTFAKNIIDPASLDFFIQNINKIENLLSRTLIWRSFFEMIKDAKMKTERYVNLLVQSLSAESSDAIFEKQFELVYTAISTYTPQKLREPLFSRMFLYIIGEIPAVPAHQKNRLVILRGKLVQFAHTEAEKQFLIDWKNGKIGALKGHEMTIGQKWSTLVKAFTLKSLSAEKKEQLFEEQKKIDPSDTAKNYEYTLRALKSTPEEFQQIYLSFCDKESKISIANKHYLASGWRNKIHSTRHAAYRKRFFDDMVKFSTVLEGDHFEQFYEGLAPDDEDLQGLINDFETIHFPAGKLDIHSRNIAKMVDDLKRRQRTYALYHEEKPHL